MDDTRPCPLPSGKCADLPYRLAVYEAGHALAARMLGLRILEVRMRPRPPVLSSDKVLGASFRSLIPVLENRCIELFGGQIAEEFACGTASCCSGDVARIDELTRLIAGLDGKRAAEDIWFELEDVAAAIFRDQSVRDAIIPVADLLYSQSEVGNHIVDGERIEALMNDLLGAQSRQPKSRLLNRFRKRG